MTLVFTSLTSSVRESNLCNINEFEKFEDAINSITKETGKKFHLKSGRQQRIELYDKKS